MAISIQDGMFTPEVIADPYAYYGRLRDEDPVHWNDTYALWVVTRHDDLVWLTRRHELFSSAVFKNDPRPPYPDIDESDLGLYDYVRNYQGDQFIQHDRPEHLEMRRVVHGYFTPKSMEAWRPFVQKAVKELLDAAEDKGNMDVMRDLATPLPVLVIAQMMGVPEKDRPYVRQLAEKLLYIGRGEYDRMKPLTEGMRGMVEYVSPLVEERIVNPGDDFISVLASGEKAGVFSRHEVLVNTSLLLLAGHETTINLLCNGTLAFMQHPDQWALLKEDPAGLAKRATEECLRYDAPVKSIQRIASQDVEMRGRTLERERPRPLVHLVGKSRPCSVPEPGQVRHHAVAKPACGLWIGRPSLPRGDPGARRGPGGLQGAGGAFPGVAAGVGRAGVPTQHYVPLAEVIAGHLAIGGVQWPASCASG